MLVLVALLIVLSQVTAVPRPPAAAPPIPPAPPSGPGAGPTAPVLEAPPPFETQRQEIEQAARSGVQQQVSLRLTESQINDLITQRADPNSPIRNLRVAVGQSDLALTGTTVWRGRQVYLTVTGRPYPVNGRLGFQLHGGSVGNLRLPQSVINSFQQRIDEAVASANVDERIRVDDVAIVQGQVIISGLTQARATQP
jgi:hypothetical protein